MIFKRENFIVIQGFAVTDLKLSGNELICYSLIYGFSQDIDNPCRCSLAYISSAMNVTRPNAKAIIGRLINKGFIFKNDVVVSGVKYCEYTALVPSVTETITPPVTETATRVTETITPPVTETATRVTETITPPVTETATNNITNKINNNITDNIAEQNDLFGNAPKSKDKKTLFRNSEIYALADIEKNDYSKVEELFKGYEYANIDIVYYFHSVADWSDSSNTKRTKRGWEATIRNFIRSDIEKGKLHTLSQQPQIGFDFAAAQEYLNM